MITLHYILKRRFQDYINGLKITCLWGPYVDLMINARSDTSPVVFRLNVRLWDHYQIMRILRQGRHVPYFD